MITVLTTITKNTDPNKQKGHVGLKNNVGEPEKRLTKLIWTMYNS